VVLEHEMVDVQTFFSGILTELKHAGKLLQQPAEKMTTSRSRLRQQRRCTGDQRRRADCHALRKPSVDMSDSESDDEHTTSQHANTSLHRRAIPFLVNDLTTRWQHTPRAVESVENDELSIIEVIVLLLTIVKHIVYEDIKSAKEISTSVYLVPNVVKILCDVIARLRLLASDETVKTLCDGDLIVAGRCLVRVLFLMLLQIGEQNNGLTWLRQCRDVELSIDCVSDSLATLCDDDKRKSLPADFVLCCWLYVDGLLLRHHANTVLVGTVCRTCELVTRRRGLDLTRSVLVRMNEGTSERSDMFVVNIVKLVVVVCRQLKLMRSRYVHCCTCSRKSHRHCNITSQRGIYRHHHDALGSAVCTLLSPSPEASTVNDWMLLCCSLLDSCLVACLSIFLLGLFGDVSDRQVQMYLLDAFEKGSVTCCCLPVNLLVGTLIGSHTLSQPCELRSKSLNVLISVLLNDCSGSVARGDCAVCDNVSNASDKTSDSLYVRQWSCLSQFAEIVRSGDSTFTIHVISQAARLAGSDNEALKQQLFCGFFMPLLATVVQQLTGCSYDNSRVLAMALSADTVPSAAKLTLSALSVILVSNELVQHFIDAHGIEMICKLADVIATRRSSLSLLEVLVNIENCSSERGQRQTALRAADGDVTAESYTALDAFLQLMFTDCNDRQWRENLRESLQSSDGVVSWTSDVWHCACRLFARNGLFRERFVALSGPQLADALLVAASETFLALDCGPSTSDIRVAVFYGQSELSHVHERNLLFLVRSTLSVCLHCTSLDVGIPQQVNMLL